MKKFAVAGCVALVSGLCWAGVSQAVESAVI